MVHTFMRLMLLVLKSPSFIGTVFVQGADIGLGCRDIDRVLGSWV